MFVPDHDLTATRPPGAAIAGSLAPSGQAASILHDLRALDGQTGRQAAGAASGSPMAAKGVADIVIRLVARLAAAVAEELRIRRDMRELRAMDEHMLRDIGLTRADIGIAVRYGRD